MEEILIVKANFQDGSLEFEDSNKELVKELKEKLKNKPFRIPLYQRPYEWDRDNVEALIKDINESKGKYFIGNIIVEERNSYLDLIDGQQRLTTIYLLCKIIGKNYFKLSYEIREELQNFLEEKIVLHNENMEDFQRKLNRLKSSIKDENRSDIYRIVDNLENIINTVRTLKGETSSIKKELEKLLEKIELSITFLPKTVDPVKYFETMNSRGKQLENHQVVKAKLISRIEKEQQRLYSVIWDYCSKINAYLEDLIQKKIEKKEIRKKLLDFAFSDTKSLAEIKSIIDISSHLDDNSNNDNYESDKKITCIMDIIEKGTNGKTEKIKNINFLTEYTTPIRKFSIFLLHALKLYFAYKNNTKDVAINDIKLIKQFEYFENKDKEVKEFIEFLLRIRILYDYFIFKRDEKGNPDFYKKEPKNKDKANLYKNLLMIELLFNVSSSSEQHWITASLWYLLNKGKEIWNKDEKKIEDLLKRFAIFLEELDNAFAIKRLQEGNSEITLIEIINNYLKSKEIKFETLENNSREEPREEFKEKLNKELNKGTSTPHYWFYKLDYLLWKNWENIIKTTKFEAKFENFEYAKVKEIYTLSKRNSIEHIYPQSKADKKPEWKNYKNIFGNLALISNYMNSKLLDQDFLDKRAEIQKQLNNKTIESLKLLLVYSKYKKWTPENCKEHHNEMINILAKDLEEPQGESIKS